MAAFALTTATAAAGELQTFDMESKFVDIGSQAVGPPGTGNPERANNLGVNVLLPDGYDPSKAYPVLYLLHGAAQAYDHWAVPSMGNAAELTKDLGAIVVMPQGGAIGFYSDWRKDGGPRWESYYLRELIPEIERRYKIRKGRRWRAIAGLSMGGFGTMYLASQRPGYFGAAASFSGVLSPQDDLQLQLLGDTILPAAWDASLTDIFGPGDGWYAKGHNPAQLLDNLARTRLFVSSGSAAPCAGDGLGQDFGGLGPQAPAIFQPPLFTPSAPALLVGLETITRRESNTFTANAEKLGLEPAVQRPCGIHWWDTFRRGLREATKWGLFNKALPKPRRWAYRTTAQQADAWGLRFRLAESPTALTVLQRDGRRIKGTGEGTIRFTTRRCRFTATLPFERDLPRRCRV